MKSSPKQGKNETNDINNGTNSPLGCQEVTAEQILHVISHPIFQNILQIIQKPLIEKIEILEKSNNELNQKIKEIEKNNTVITQKVQQIKIREKDEPKPQGNTKTSSTLYDHMKMEKQNNLIMTGLNEEENEDLKKKITEILEAKFDKKGVQFECTRIGNKMNHQPIETHENKKPRAIKIIFSNIWDKRSIYFNRMKQLQNSGLYINEDLMPNKQKLAYLARKMKREKKIYSTFTCDGEVYFKETELSEPKVFTEEFIKIHSQQNENTEVFLSCQNSNSSI